MCVYILHNIIYMCWWNCDYTRVQVHLQTQQKGKIGLIRMGIKVVKSDGIFGLYNGLTASLLRQVTHTVFVFSDGLIVLSRLP